ncbi:MAG: 16S rRNA (guanine(527)-N(7))-methyltransferase RsmG [Firmicutes bacterium]|nr:16S rRNA (guanine(527)-N(7))-methyltransferase RsmG [Bacillota bacterium]
MENSKSFLPAFLQKSTAFLQKNEKFEKYFEILINWNNKINLTTIIEKEEVYLKHFLDSIIAEEFIDNGASVLDIGSGAGFPALPLAIIREDINFLLVEAVGKKVNFLNEVIKELAITNSKVIHSRIEDLKKINKTKYDYVTAKAVAKLNTLIEYALPYLKIGGKLIAYKSNDIDEEIKDAKNALCELCGEIVKIGEIQLDENIKRKIIVIQKIKENNNKYPREGNKPRIKPL